MLIKFLVIFAVVTITVHADVLSDKPADAVSVVSKGMYLIINDSACLHAPNRKGIS